VQSCDSSGIEYRTRSCPKSEDMPVLFSQSPVMFLACSHACVRLTGRTKPLESDHRDECTPERPVKAREQSTELLTPRFPQAGSSSGLGARLLNTTSLISRVCQLPQRECRIYLRASRITDFSRIGAPRDFFWLSKSSRMSPFQAKTNREAEEGSGTSKKSAEFWRSDPFDHPVTE
jgi:hypothetical protein